MKHKRKIISVLCLLSLFISFSLPASANSAQHDWSGRDECGVMTVDGDCPLIVEHETLTFDLQEFPDYRGYSEQDLASYTGRVTAEYTFYNPSDLTITARMAFPLTETYNTYPGEFTDYKITVDGEAIDANIRHTVINYLEDFDVDTDLYRLKDDYIKDDFFTGGDLLVNKYVITMPAFEGGEFWGGARCGIDISPSDYPNTMFYFPSGSMCHVLDNGTYRVYSNRVRPYSTITYYAIGEEPSALPSFKVYYDWKCNDSEVLAVGTKSEKIEALTLNDLIFKNYDEKCGVSHMDWYNANLEILKARRDSGNPLASLSDFSTWPGYLLTVWYCYEVTVGPGERITNTISAPMYPDVDTSYDPVKYTYTYLLSPAGTWADFGTLDIYVNTPYYISNSSVGKFETTDNGYELHLEGLPKDAKGNYKELQFVLRTEPVTDTVRSIFSIIGDFFSRIIDFFKNMFNSIFG